jgi:ATP-dependent protease Clp ATPase subunit
MSEKDWLCSFCSKGASEVKKLVAGPFKEKSIICNECVEFIHTELLADLQEPEEESETLPKQRIMETKKFQGIYFEEPENWDNLFILV